MRLPVLLLFAATVLTIASSCAKKSTAAAAVGDDGVDWAARARQYRDDPAALRLFTEQCEENEERLIAAQRELTTYRNQSGTTSQELQAARAAAAQTQQRLQLIEQENAQLRRQLATPPPPNDEVDTDQQMVRGVIFQVQLGAYAKNTLDPNLATENALELQDQNGLQKVVVSQFRTYANAAALRDRLKEMGVKDAFIVAKNDGVRITIPEALQLSGQG